MNGLMNLSLLKVDVEQRLVVARAAAEEKDKSGETMDWATAKPEFQRWSQSFVDATGGLSKGNVRLMHDPKHIAGKVVEITFDDMAKAVNVVCKVVDDAAWKLCLEGCITGISIGGSYGPKWTDAATGLKKYTPKITEISLVDNPCIPSARIVQLIKADGAAEQLHLHGRARSFDDVMGETLAKAVGGPRDFAAVLDSLPRDFNEVLGKGDKPWDDDGGETGDAANLDDLSPEQRGRAWARARKQGRDVPNWLDRKLAMKEGDEGGGFGKAAEALMQKAAPPRPRMNYPEPPPYYPPEPPPRPGAPSSAAPAKKPLGAFATASRAATGLARFARRRPKIASGIAGAVGGALAGAWATHKTESQR